MQFLHGFSAVCRTKSAWEESDSICVVFGAFDGFATSCFSVFDIGVGFARTHRVLGVCSRFVLAVMEKQHKA